jgi:hypothetical protein
VQSAILRTLAAHRSPESYVAGSTPLHRDGPRFSGDIEALQMSDPVDAGEIARRLRAALDAAEFFARAMPAGKEGLLFLKNGEAVQPDPTNLGIYAERAGSRQVVWPGSSEISSAMLERFGKPPP